MTPLKRYQMALTLFVVSSFPIIYLSLYVHAGFLALLGANILFWSWRAKSVRCSKCGSAVAPPIGASALEIFRSLRHSTCKNCGIRLD